MGNNSFIDARSNVKKSFILAIIAAAFSLFSMNYYRVSYETDIIFKHLFKTDGQDYSNPFVDMLWWISLLSLIATVVLIVVITYSRFKWTNKLFIAIPAGVKLVCSIAQVFITYVRDYKLIAASEGVYGITDTFLLFSLVYIAGLALVLVSIFLPGKLLKIIAYTGVFLVAAVGAISFFLPAPHSIPYELLSTEISYSYRALSSQVAEFVGLLAIVAAASGLDVYHRCLKEDAAAMANQ